MFDIEKLSKGDIIVWNDNTTSIFEGLDVEKFMLEFFLSHIKKIRRGKKTVYNRKSNKEVNT